MLPVCPAPSIQKRIKRLEGYNVLFWNSLDMLVSGWMVLRLDIFPLQHLNALITAEVSRAPLLNLLILSFID